MIEKPPVKSCLGVGNSWAPHRGGMLLRPKGSSTNCATRSGTISAMRALAERRYREPFWLLRAGEQQHRVATAPQRRGWHVLIRSMPSPDARPSGGGGTDAPVIRFNSSRPRDSAYGFAAVPPHPEWAHHAHSDLSSPSRIYPTWANSSLLHDLRGRRRRRQEHRLLPASAPCHTLRPYSHGVIRGG